MKKAINALYPVFGWANVAITGARVTTKLKVAPCYLFNIEKTNWVAWKEAPEKLWYYQVCFLYCNLMHGEEKQC